MASYTAYHPSRRIGTFMPPRSQGRHLIFALLRVIPLRPDDITPITPVEDTRAAANPRMGPRFGARGHRCIRFDTAEDFERRCPA